MYTAMAFVALTMGTLSTNPTFLDDYRAAQAKVTVAGKPMAVFVGSGKAGWESVIREGGFDPAATKLLAEKFVCLYVDSSTPAGKSLASAFQVGDRGVVLSDRIGLTQVYSAVGTVSRAELTRALVAYADVKDVPKATETKGAAPAAPGTVIVGPGTPGGPIVTGGGNFGGAAYGGGMGCGHSNGCAQPACGASHGCSFLSKCGFGGGHSMGCGHQTQCAPAPCAQPACGQSKGCCFSGFMSKCGFGGGHGGGMGGGCGGCK